MKKFSLIRLFLWLGSPSCCCITYPRGHIPCAALRCCLLAAYCMLCLRDWETNSLLYHGSHYFRQSKSSGKKQGKRASSGRKRAEFLEWCITTVLSGVDYWSCTTRNHPPRKYWKERGKEYFLRGWGGLCEDCTVCNIINCYWNGVQDLQWRLQD